MGDRITKALKLLDESKISNYKIWQSTGISQGTLSNYTKGKTKPTPANAEVLINYLEGTTPTISNAKALDDVEYMLVPLIPISARAGYLSGSGDDDYIESLPTIPVIVDKHYKGKYRTFEVDGDSMDNGTRNAIYDKDRVLCREVQRHLWQYKLHFNDWFFVIVHREEGVIIKQIVDHDIATGEIKCHSLNPMFQDFTLCLNDVVELYNVIKIVDRNTRI